MKRTIVFDEQLIQGIAEVTDNWSYHKDKFIEFAIPYWIRFYGEENLENLKSKVNDSEKPLTCRIRTLDFFYTRILMLYCLLTQRGFVDYREQVEVEVSDIHVDNNVIDYDAAAERFLSWNSYTPEEELFRPKNDFDTENREKFNRIYQSHLHKFMDLDEAFSKIDNENDRFRHYCHLHQRTYEIKRVRRTFVGTAQEKEE